MTFEDIKKKIVNITLTSDFGPYDYEDYDEVIDTVSFELKHEFGDDIEYKIRHGASKLVIIFPEFDEVIKIPFNGIWLQYENDEGDYVDKFTPFEHARCENKWDYCAVECNIYSDAEDAGLEDFFARPERIGFTKDNHPVYVQKKAVAFDDVGAEVSDERITEASKVADIYDTGICYAWIAEAISCYGRELVDSLLAFLSYNEYDYDLREANIGFDAETGAPVLIDFAGFFEE